MLELNVFPKGFCQPEFLKNPFILLIILFLLITFGVLVPIRHWIGVFIDKHVIYIFYIRIRSYIPKTENIEIVIIIIENLYFGSVFHS